MAEQFVNREQLNNQVATTVPQLVKESKSQADRFLGSVANSISKLVFRWGMTSAFRIANTNTPKFPFSNDLLRMSLILKKVLLILFYTTVGVQLFAQHYGLHKFDIDSLRHYTEDQKEYTFYVDGGTQGLYVDSINTWNNGFYLNVVNNTSDTIIFNYKTRDCAAVWFQNKSSYRYGDPILWRFQSVPFNVNLS